MKNLLAPLLPAVACAFLCLSCATGPQRGARVLLLAGPDSHGWGAHEHAAGVDVLADALNRSETGITATVYREGWPNDPAILATADAVVVFGDGGPENLLNGHEDELRRLAAGGVGFAILHYALEVDPATGGPALLDVLGGFFDPTWSVNPMWEMHDPIVTDHPVTRGVNPFDIKDEWYYHIRFRDGLRGVTPLLSAVPPPESVSDADGPRTGNPAVREAVRSRTPQVLAWATENPDGGRAFGFTGGHVHANWTDADYRTLVLNGIVWVAGGDVPRGGVPSARPLIVRNKTILQAVSKGDADDVETHIKLGASVTETNKSGWTALHYAAVRGQREVAEVLIRYGADVNAKTVQGNTCLQFCAQRNTVDVAEVLIEHGADLNAGDADGWTPLHHAAARDKLEVARLLIAKGANVKALSTRGGTPLHEGAASAGKELLLLLLEHGADPNVKAQNGKTALDYARELGNEAAEKILAPRTQP